ncbi:hypothetical protein LXL04_019665 [Taraxacum kok-saghyz]
MGHQQLGMSNWTGEPAPFGTDRAGTGLCIWSNFRPGNRTQSVTNRKKSVICRNVAAHNDYTKPNIVSNGNGVPVRCAGDSFFRRMVSFWETERPAISFRKDGLNIRHYEQYLSSCNGNCIRMVNKELFIIPKI